MIPHGKEVVRGKHKVVLCFETKRGYRMPAGRLFQRLFHRG
jgi:hypothetical protein